MRASARLKSLDAAYDRILCSMPEGPSGDSRNLQSFREAAPAQLTTSAAAPASDHSINFPAAPIPGTFEGLAHPVAQSTSVESRRDPPDAPRVGALTWISRGIKALVTSSELCSGAGSTVLSVATGNISGLVLHPIASVLGAINGFRQRYFPHPERDQEGSAPREGFRALLWEKFHSPGVYRIITASVFIGSTIEAAWRADLGSSLVFGLCILANAAGARLLNRSYAVPERKPLPIEKFAHKFWEALPEAAQTVLANPTIPFSLASILIGTRGINPPELLAPLNLTSFLLAGTVFLRGAYQAIRAGEFFEPRPMSFILSGLSQVAMAVSNLSSGNRLNALSLLCYSGANFIFAARMAQKASSHKQKD